MIILDNEYLSTLFEEIFNKLTIPILAVDENFIITTFNNNFSQKYGSSDEDENFILNLISTKDQKKVKNELVLLFNSRKEQSFLHNITINDFNNNSVEIDMEMNFLDKTGELLINFYEVVSENLDEVYQKYKTIFNNTNDALFLIDVTEDHELVYDLLNPTHEKLTGLKTEEVKGKTPQDLLGEEVGAQVENKYRKCLNQKGTISYEEKLDLPNGTKYWLTKLSPVIIDGKVTKIIGSAKDITQMKEQRAEIEYISFHDQLTGLYNRRFYDEKVKEIEEERKFPVTIIVGDLNGLKITNDVFGHEAGDGLLKLTAEILKNSTRRKDYLVRWGGDEFCIIAPETNFKEGKEILDRINTRTGNSNFRDIPVSIALGLATKKSTEQSLSMVFNEAEENMYRNKERQKEKFNNRLLQSLLTKLEKSNYYVVDHSHRMVELAAEFAAKFDFPDNKKDRLMKAIKVHDIGKLALDQEMLKQETEFSNEQLNKFKKHPEYSYKIINNFKSFHRITSDIIHHHEHWDGSGYPDNLEGKNIPRLSRIIAVIDAFDALTFNGINHELTLDDFNTSMDDKQALEKIKEYSGVYFDPEIVGKFSQLI